MAEHSAEKKSGCASMIYGGLFRKRFWLRRTTCTSSNPTTTGSNNGARGSNSKRRRGSDEAAFLEDPNSSQSPVKVIDNPKSPQFNGKKYPSGAASGTSRAAPVQGGLGNVRKVPKEAIGISGELDSMINDHQQSKGSSNLVRASSSNVMLFGNLGNLRQPGTGTGGVSNNPGNAPATSADVLDYLPKTAREMSSQPNGKNGNGPNSTRNIVKGTGMDEQKEQAGSLCRALSTRMDPEQLKAMGNEDYKEGRYAEALALYDRAIGLDPDKASYRSNKSAALTALGQLLEAVFECREAIRIESTYHRAHLRLATLCLRLGDADKALYHYKQSGPEASSSEITQAKTLQASLNKCTEVKKLKDWNAVVKETGNAISSGADSAPQIFSLQAEAFLKLHRHEDANATMSKSPKFDVDECTKFYGPITNANVLLIRAQVDMALGRFEDAVAAAEQAARLDSSNKDINVVMRRARGVALARTNGNELFKASKFMEACTAYGEGLDHDPLNSVLLCNRAACRAKMGQFEKAVEDCTKALNVRPSYSKARLRRADCNTKLERWEASFQDYEVLKKELPGDEEVGRALLEAQTHLQKPHCQKSTDMKFDTNVVNITSNDDFRQHVTSPEISVVLFCNKSSEHQQALVLMDQLHKRYPSMHFIKVVVEELPQVAKSEGVSSSLPVFRMYRNGSRIKDIPGTNLELLESTVKFYSTS